MLGNLVPEGNVPGQETNFFSVYVLRQTQLQEEYGKETVHLPAPHFSVLHGKYNRFGVFSSQCN